MVIHSNVNCFTTMFKQWGKGLQEVLFFFFFPILNIWRNWTQQLHWNKNKCYVHSKNEYCHFLFLYPYGREWNSEPGECTLLSTCARLLSQWPNWKIASCLRTSTQHCEASGMTGPVTWLYSGTSLTGKGMSYFCAACTLYVVLFMRGTWSTSFKSYCLPGVWGSVCTTPIPRRDADAAIPGLLYSTIGMSAGHDIGINRSSSGGRWVRYCYAGASSQIALCQGLCAQEEPRLLGRCW